MSQLSLDFLLDAFIALYYDCKSLPNPSPNVANFTLKYKSTVSQLENERIKTRDYDIIKTFATGSVGRVCLAKSKNDGRYYAIKILKKQDLLSRREAAFFMEEKESMILGRNSTWLTKLYKSFQDEQNLYIMMEYVPGGSLKGLIDMTEDPMEEQNARFYIAEMILGIEEVHNLGFIHRDIKPDNFLVCASGHLKLTDFGSCIRIDHAKTLASHETVGTPDYICPEILRAHEGTTRLDETCDWWSLGICVFELLYNEVPFYAETLVETYGKIMDHNKYFEIPDFRVVSEESIDFMKRLVCSQENRLGHNGINEIKLHKWLSTIDWININQVTAPFIPTLQGPEDTHYFDVEDMDTAVVPDKKSSKAKDFAGHNLPFIGYTFLSEVDAGEPIMTPKERRVSDEEMTHLNKALEEERKARQKLQNSLAELEKQKIQIESDNRRLQLSHDLNLHEKQNIAAQLKEINDNRQLETDHLAEYNKLISRYDALDSERSSLQTLAHSNQSKINELEIQLCQFSSQYSDTQLELQNLRQRLNVESLVKSDLEKRVEELQIALDSELLGSSEKVAQIRKAQEAQQSFEMKIQTLENRITNLSDESQGYQDVVFSLEKQKAGLELKLQESGQQLVVLSAETQKLKDRLSSLKPEAEQSEDVIKALNAEISELHHNKSLILAEISKLMHQQVEKDMELEKLKGEQEDVRLGLMNAKAHQIDLEDRLLESIRSAADFKEKFIQLEGQLASSNSRVSTLKDCLRKENEMVIEQAAKITSLQDLVSKIQKQLEAQAAATNAEQNISRSLQAEVIRLEASLSAEKICSIAKDKSLNEQILLSETLQNENASQKEQINIIMRQYDAFVAESQSALSASKKEYGELEFKYSVEYEKRINLEAIKATMTRLVMDLEAAAKRESDERLRLDQLLDDANRKVDVLELQILENQRLAGQKGRLHESVDSLALRTSESSDRGFLDKTPRKGHRLSFKGFFRSSATIGDTNKSLPHVEGDVDSILGHDRSLSIDTCTRSQISLDSFDGILKGWLKVPKGGKLRKGWAEKFFIVKEYKLYLYDREADSEYLDGILVADFGGSIFLAKAVAPNEVIHVNAKDVNSIFKIQANSAKKTPTQENSTMISIPEKTAAAIKKKISKLQADLLFEEKMQQAAEKILHATTDSQRPVVLGQLEASGKRIENLKAELDLYLQALDASPNNEKEDEADPAIKENANNLKKELERQIEIEYRKKDALHRIEASKTPKKSSKATADYLDELQVIDRAVLKLKETVAILESDDLDGISRILQKFDVTSTHLGHHFKVKQFYKIMDCTVCHEALWGNKNQGLECSVCKEICHKNCMPLIDISCKEVLNLKSVPTMYFMAKDPSDRARWLYGLNHFRRELESQKKLLNGTAPKKASSSSTLLGRSSMPH